MALEPTSSREPEACYWTVPSKRPVPQYYRARDSEDVMSAEQRWSRVTAVPPCYYGEWCWYRYGVDIDTFLHFRLFLCRLSYFFLSFSVHFSSLWVILRSPSFLTLYITDSFKSIFLNSFFFLSLFLSSSFIYQIPCVVSFSSFIQSFHYCFLSLLL